MSEENENPDANAGGDNSPAQDAQQKADAANDAAQENAAWYKALPEDKHESLKDFENIDDAISAIKAGKDYIPAKDIKEYDLKLKAPGLDDTAPELESFKKFCFENQIPPEKAQGLLDYQTTVYQESMEAQKELAESSLKVEWGNKYETNVERAKSALAAIDKDLDGQLAKELEKGAGNNPAIIKALLWVSDKIGEDSLGAGGPGGKTDMKPISRKQAYSEIFKT